MLFVDMAVAVLDDEELENVADGNSGKDVASAKVAILEVERIGLVVEELDVRGVDPDSGLSFVLKKSNI